MDGWKTIECTHEIDTFMRDTDITITFNMDANDKTYKSCLWSLKK